MLALSIAVFGTAPGLVIALSGPGASPQVVNSRVGIAVLVGYVPMLLGLGGLARARTMRLDRQRMLDILVIVLSLALPCWDLLGLAVFGARGLTPIDRVVALSGPALDLVVLVAVLHLLALPGRRPRPLWWILGSLGFAAFSNVAQSVATLHRLPDLPAWASLGWMLAGWAEAMAALDPTMAEAASSAPQGQRRFGIGQAAVLGLAVAAIPGSAILEFTLHHQINVYFLAGGTLILGALLVRRIWGLFRAQEEGARVASRERYLNGIVRNLRDVIVVSDGRGNFLYVSAAMRDVLGYDAEDVKRIGTSNNWVHPDDLSTVTELMKNLRPTQGASGTVEVRGQHADGSWVWFELTVTNLTEDPNVQGMLTLAHEITERREFERQLEHRALHDSLTGLPNRALLVDRLATALARVARRGEQVELLFVDLDDFKAVNDTLGHAAGDDLLTEVSRRLRTALRLDDTVARLGGDEFAIIAEAHLPPGLIARRIREALQAPFDIQGRRLTVTASVGVARSDAASTVDLLLRNADLAMYQAKAAGKNQARDFTAKMYEEAADREQLLADLRGALDRQEFRLAYQPIIEVSSDEPVGVEALLRWQHPTRGLLGPDRFIPLAEQSGLIVPIGRWVLAEACRQVAAWDDEPGRPRLGVAVNLSLRQLDSDGIVDDVAAALQASGIHPCRLTLEVTESLLMHDVAAATARLGALKSLGIRLAVDDFGTGYSSLAYLQQLPIDLLKIDRAFVTQVATNPEARALFRSMIQMAEALHVSTVAEGVEDEDQLGVVREERCDLVQGFLFARPLSAEDLASFTASAPVMPARKAS